MIKIARLPNPIFALANLAFSRRLRERVATSRPG